MRFEKFEKAISREDDKDISKKIFNRPPRDSLMFESAIIVIVRMKVLEKKSDNRPLNTFSSPLSLSLSLSFSAKTRRGSSFSRHF